MNKITVKIDGMMCGVCKSRAGYAARLAFSIIKEAWDE